MIGRGKLPAGFLWGAAYAGHQVEGGNVNSDIWLLENVTPTIYRERSGDACDTYHRYREDAALAASAGFNSLRLSVEWSRIEPEAGVFSAAALDHYARVLDALREHGLTPFVTLSHFAVPRWFAARGGFEESDSAELFGRFADRVGRRLEFEWAATFNEPNLPGLIGWIPAFRHLGPAVEAMEAAAGRACGSNRFSSGLRPHPQRQTTMIAAHRLAYSALKATRPHAQVGATLAIVDEQGVGEKNRAEEKRDAVYRPWLRALRETGDYVGVQTYTRSRVGPECDLLPEPGVPLTQMGWEFWPQALGATIRFAARESGKPVVVTENGIATDDDAQRMAYVDVAVQEMMRCVEDGIDVRGYLHWTLLDNFEWIHGFGPKFGLVAVDRATFVRTPKPSLSYLGDLFRTLRAGPQS